MADRWSEKSLRTLFHGVGSYGIQWFRNQTKTADGSLRSRQAIYAAARRLYGLGGLTRGAWTLRRFIEHTGYQRTHLFRARSALRQKWKRLGPGGAYLITEEQKDEIVEWLKHDYWSAQKRLYCCLACHTEVKPHYSYGLCRRCYFKYRRYCVRNDLPVTLGGQNKLLIKLVNSGIDKSLQNAKLLAEMQRRFKKGYAFTMRQLDYLESLL